MVEEDFRVNSPGPGFRPLFFGLATLTIAGRLSTFPRGNVAKRSRLFAVGARPPKRWRDREKPFPGGNVGSVSRDGDALEHRQG